MQSEQKGDPETKDTKNERPDCHIQSAGIALINHNIAPAIAAAAGTAASFSRTTLIWISGRAPSVVVARPCSAVNAESAVIPTSLASLEWIGY